MPAGLFHALQNSNRIGTKALRRRSASVLLISLGMGAFVSCSRDTSTAAPDATFGSQEILILQGKETLQVTPERMTGSGTFAFVTSLGAVQDGSSFDFAFTLQETGSITLVTYANETLSDGIEYTITNEGGSVKMTYSSGQRVHDLSSVLPESTKETVRNRSAATRLWVDVHNNEFPLHTLIWSGSSEPKDAINPESAFFNSESLLTPAERESGSYTFPSAAGRGRFWGFRLNNAELTDARRTDPLYEEEVE